MLKDAILADGLALANNASLMPRAAKPGCGMKSKFPGLTTTSHAPNITSLDMNDSRFRADSSLLSRDRE